MKSLTVGILLTWCSWAWSQQAPPLQLTLDQALQLAEARNPDLRLSSQSVAVSRSAITIAEQRPNPTLTAATPIGPAERKQSLIFSVPLETGGRRDARIAVAESGVREAELGMQQVRLTVLNQTRNAFVELGIAQAALEQSRRDVQFYDRLVDAARQRFEAGDVAEAEVIRARFEREQIQRNVYPVEGRLESARLNLNRLLGQVLETRVEVVSDRWLFPDETTLKAPPWELSDLASLRQLAQKQRPDLALSSQQIETASRRVSQALAEQSPALALQGSLLYHPVIPAFTYMVGVQVELPWGSDRGGEVEQAQARREEALLRQQVAQASADHAVVSAWTSYQAARRQLSHDLEVLRPQAERVLSLAEKIYEIGQGDITDVLLVGQSVQRQRQLLLADFAQLHQALGQLELAVNARLVGAQP